MKTRHNSIFSNTYISLESDTYLSIEEFSTQDDDYILETLQKEFVRLKEVIIENKIKKPTNVFKNKVCTSVLSRIETLIVDRFGIQIKFNGSNDEKEVFKSVLLPPTTLEINKIDFSNSDNVLKEVKKIEDSWNMKGINIDNDKIKVQGLPKDYDIILLSNFMLMLEKDFTDVDMAILLINEVGKIFHYLRLSYSPLKETHGFYSTLTNLIHNKNMEPKRALVEAYSKTTKDTKLDTNDSGLFATIMITIRKYISYIISKFKSYDAKKFINNFKVSMSSKLESYLNVNNLLNPTLNTFLTFIVTVGVLALLIYMLFLLYPFAHVISTVLKAFGLFILGCFLLYLLRVDRINETTKSTNDTMKEIRDIIKEQANNNIINEKLSTFKNNILSVVDGVGSFSKSVFSTMFNLGTDNKIDTKALDAAEVELKGN